MGKLLVPEPILFPVRPVTKGKNISEPPQNIDARESPSLMNVRSYHGQLASRDGFKAKYYGAWEPILHIDVAYASGGALQALVAFGLTKVFQIDVTGTLVSPVRVRDVITITGDLHNGTAVVDDLSAADYAKVQAGSYIEHASIPADATILYKEGGDLILSQNSTGDENDVTITVRAEVALDTNPELDTYSVDVGSNIYDCHAINAKAQYPAAGYADIMAFTNSTDGVFILIAASDGTPMAVEKIYDTAGVGLAGARAVLFFANRLLVLGSTNSKSEILWSKQEQIDEFDPTVAGEGGARLLGDGIDWIQAAMRMGELAIVYKERSIHVGRKTMKADPPIDFEPAPGQGIGLAAPASVGDLGEEHIFLGWDDVYIFSQKGIDSIADRVKDDIFGHTGSGLGILPEYLSRCIGVIAEEFDEYWLFVPTGKFPNATNLLTRGAMDFVATTGDTINTDATVTAIPAADWALIRPGDSIAGAGIPAGAAIVSKPASGSVEMDARATGTASVALTIGTVNGDQTWLILLGGNAVCDTLTTGSHFGGMYQRLTGSSAHYTYLLQVHDYGSLQGAGKVLSVLTWVKITGISGTATIILYLQEQDSGGAAGTTHTVNFTFTADHTDFVPIMYSVTSADADMQKIRVGIAVLGQSINLDVDAIQVVDITDLEDRHIYTHPTTGYQAPAYADVEGNPALIPLIVDRVGPWVCDTVWVYNYRDNAWSCWRLPLTGFGYDVLSTTETIANLTGTVEEQTWRFDDRMIEEFAPTNLIATGDGQIYELSRAYSKDWHGLLDRAVLYWWESKDFDLGRPHLDKTFARIIIYHEISHPAIDITVGMSTDSGSGYNEQVVTIRTGFTQTYADFFMTGTQGRFRVKADEPGMAITGFAVKIIPRGEAHDFN